MSGSDESAQRRVVARATDDRGELALAHRGDAVELIVNGTFAMDTVDPSTEAALATLALGRLPGGGLRVLVGGLGLGFTVRALLGEPRVAHVEVVELHAALVGWALQGVVATFAGVLDDPRVAVTVGDVLDVVPGLPAGTFDAVLLDVDNGPGFLIHDRNAAVYRPDFLTSAARVLAPSGVLAVWSADPSPELADALARLGRLDVVTLDVARDGRAFTYTVYLAGIGLPTPGRP